MCRYGQEMYNEAMPVVYYLTSDLTLSFILKYIHKHSMDTSNV